MQNQLEGQVHADAVQKLLEDTLQACMSSGQLSQAELPQVSSDAQAIRHTLFIITVCHVPGPVWLCHGALEYILSFLFMRQQSV